MNGVTEWVREVMSIILSITFLEIMLPEGSIKKYVKFIFAIVIMAVLISPINIFMHNGQ